eukprot:CAMPEP_0116923316 /NCGR_PEP_ID=MMETSP0467-20121206/22808_1 /TAXON_ID=283647 /ORGANISM="Mesodinium pulex, Strain SPMC105" /LENGTH=60 /DNA_ID=CAMNT_0004601861 /DNA_START=475 /DNA_END=660 /DNA_ORIENTATION=-
MKMKKCWISNVGDSTAVVCMGEHGKMRHSVISTDHKPLNVNEKRRIINNGGEVIKNEGDP